MSHGLDENTNMMYIGETPWHGLGVKLPHGILRVADIPEVCPAVAFEQALQPMYYERPDGTIAKSTTARALIRTDTGAELNVVGMQYSPLQWEDRFGFFDPLVAAGVAEYSTAGALEGGRRTWIQAKLNKPIRVGRDDIIEKTLLLSDGVKVATTVGATNDRVVCENTLTAAMVGLNVQAKIRHTRSNVMRLEELTDIIMQAERYYEAVGERFNRMAEVGVTGEQVADFCRVLVPDPTEGKSTVRATNQREAIMRLFENGPGAELETAKGTVWGLYNAATAFVDHERGTNREKRLVSQWFGSGKALKQTAFDAATALAA